MSRHHVTININARRWVAARRQVFERDGWRCSECGRAGRLECDHIVPLQCEPGQDPYDMNWLQTLCRSCHIQKTAGENRRPLTDAEAAWRGLVTGTLDRALIFLNTGDNPLSEGGMLETTLAQGNFMTATQRKIKALFNEESSVKETLTTLTGKAELSDEERAQLGESEQRYTAMQVEIRAARTLVEAEGEGETRDAAPGAEDRERVELRSRCRVGNILAATLAGRATSGPELELQSELGFASSHIPTELWQRPERRDGTETRAISPTPSTVGVNMGGRRAVRLRAGHCIADGLRTAVTN